jgi:hypothetical protein
VRERVLLYCAASGTDWQHAGVTGDQVITMVVKGLDLAGCRRTDHAHGSWPRRAAGDAAGPMKVSPDQKRALQLLADAGLNGCTESIMLAHGFTIGMQAGLVRNGWATAEPERVRAGGRSIKVVRVLITAAGRRAAQRP